LKVTEKQKKNKEEEEKDLKQLEEDFKEQGYELIWFVQNFIDVRRERMKDNKLAGENE